MKHDNTLTISGRELDRLLRQAREVEREACAGTCEIVQREHSAKGMHILGGHVFAEAIRARAKFEREKP